MSREHDHGMSVVVKTVTRLTVGLILLYGIYIVLHGHVTPGGGFAGGVIIALSFVHLVLGFGKETAFKKLDENATGFFEGFGALLFLALALAGLSSGGHFFLNLFKEQGEPFKLVSAGIIAPCNIAISLKVSAGLFSIFIALTVLRPESENK